MRLLVVTVLVFAGLTASAVAGGWATVALSSTPDEVGPGKTWVVTMDIRQHGVTPMQGDWVKPAMIVNGKRYPATFTGRDGLFRAEIPLPKSGRVEYAADDGFSQMHQFPVVDLDKVTAPVPATPVSTAGSAGGDDGWLIGALAGTSLILAACAALWRPRRRAARRAAMPLTAGH